MEEEELELKDNKHTREVFISVIPTKINKKKHKKKDYGDDAVGSPFIFQNNKLPADTDATSTSVFDVNLPRKCRTKKEPVPRVETATWGMNAETLELDKQQDAIAKLTILTERSADSYIRLVYIHIRSKCSGYRQQDIEKNIYDQDKMITLSQTIDLLHQSQCKCYYCAESVFVLYEMVREPKQWSLDRIDNNRGHNADNVVISCLSCNLKRRRQDKDTFMFTKNMKIVRHGHTKE